MTHAADSLSRITVYKRGWRYSHEVEVSGLVAAWGINTPGRLSCFVPIRGQRLTGVDWLGRWVTWEHPAMGRFAGYVEDRIKHPDTGTMELSVVGFGQILARRRTMRRYRPVSGPPGAIISRALSDVTLDAGMPFRLSVSERGPHLKYEFRGDMVMDVFDAMISASGQEWATALDDDRTLAITWRPKVGRDETARVVFTEGVNIIAAQSETTISQLVNDLLAIADNDQYSRARGARVQAMGSVGRFGRLQDTRRYVGLVNQSTLGPRAEQDLIELARPLATVTVRVAHDESRLQYIREGTEFRLVSWMDNAVYRLRCLDRTISLDEGVVTLTCDAVSDVTRKAQQDFIAWGGIGTDEGA